MVTSIADLLATFDRETARRDAHSATDASNALRVIGALLTDLRDDDALTCPCDGAIRHLADACSTAAITFETGVGRLSELAGVTRDAVAVLHNQLSTGDRWHIATGLTLPARRCAAVIARSGPYASVPQLLTVADRAHELLHVAARDPIDPDELTGLDAPIPGYGVRALTSPAAQAFEAIARLAAEFTRRGRDPMTTRQLLGMCHVAELAATQLERCSPEERDDSTQSPAAAWRRSRAVIATFADRPRIGEVTDDRILRIAAWAVTSLERTYAPEAGSELRALAPQISNLLARMAIGCSTELDRIRTHLVIGRGDRPLHDARISDWMARRAFLPSEPDLLPVKTALAIASTRWQITQAPSPPIALETRRLAR